MRSLGLVGVAVLGAWLSSHAGPVVDSTRVARQEAESFRFVPEAETTRMAASGFEEPLSDLMWVRAVITFGDAVVRHDQEAVAPWLRRMIETINLLDPSWRTAYYYGGVTLRVLGDIDGADEVFKRGAAALPKEHYFPFSVGMNAYLYRQDPQAAAEWLAQAADRPGAPRWYHSAAAAMQSRTGELDGALRYLREQLESTNDKAVRDNIQFKLDELEERKLVEGWTEACRTWRARTGERLARPEDLKKLGIELPANPRGEAWVVGGDGIVRGTSAEKTRLKRLVAAERKLLAPW